METWIHENITRAVLITNAHPSYLLGAMFFAVICTYHDNMRDTLAKCLSRARLKEFDETQGDLDVRQHEMCLAKV